MVRCDDEIKKDVLEELVWDNRVDEREVKVDVSAGRVVLAGSVPSYSSKRSAEKDAFTVPGVTAVENNLEVLFKPSTPPPADRRVKGCIENVLNWIPDIDSSSIEVSVYAGWVTMEGAVDSLWKKLKAEDVAANIVGVIGVTNKITIVPTEDISDRAIAESVISALSRNRNIDLDSIDLTVQDGIATLSGVVPSRLACDAVQEIVGHTKGVVDVRNELAVC